MDRNRYSILHYNFKISVRIFFFFFLRQLLITDHTRVPAQVNRILFFFLIWGTLMFWWGLYGWPPLSCPWGCLVQSARVWTFWFFLLPWLPLGYGDFLVALLGWSSVLGLCIVGGLTLWWLGPLCLACIGMLSQSLCGCFLLPHPWDWSSHRGESAWGRKKKWFI